MCPTGESPFDLETSTDMLLLSFSSSRGLGRALLLAVLAAPLMTSCVTRGFPTHGGGKRFFREQELVSAAIDQAVGQLDFGALAGSGDGAPSIGLFVMSMEDSGGGVQSSGGAGSSILSTLGLAAPAIDPNMGPAVAYGSMAAMSSAAASAYGSFAFESSDDLVYLKGALLEKLAENGVRVASAATEQQTGDGGNANQETRTARGPDGLLFVLVEQLGIDQNDTNVIVYGAKELSARVAVRAFYVTESGAAGMRSINSTSLGRGVSEWQYKEVFILGIGPIGNTDIVNRKS